MLRTILTRASYLSLQRSFLVLCLGACAVVHAPMILHAQELASDRQRSTVFANHDRIAVGDVVRYRAPFWYSGQTMGRVVSFSADSLRVRMPDSTESSVSTSSIWRLEVRRTHRPMIKSAGWGAGVGAVAGLLAATVLAIGSSGSGTFAPDFTPVIAPVFGGCVAAGTAIGFLVGTRERAHWERIHDATLMRTQANWTTHFGVRLSRAF